MKVERMSLGFLHIGWFRIIMRFWVQTDVGDAVATKSSARTHNIGGIPAIFYVLKRRSGFPPHCTTIKAMAKSQMLLVTPKCPAILIDV